VALVPLAVEHVDGLASAGAEDRTTYEWTWVPDGTADAAAYVDLAL
jgi:hypothetical protein